MRTKNCSVATRWVHKQRCPRIIGISIWSLRWKDSFLVLCYRKKNISVFKFRRSEFWWILSKTSLNPLYCWSSFHSLGPSSGLGWETQHGKIQTIEPQRRYLPRTKCNATTISAAEVENSMSDHVSKVIQTIEIGNLNFWPLRKCCTSLSLSAYYAIVTISAALGPPAVVLRSLRSRTPVTWTDWSDFTKLPKTQ